MKKEQIDEHLQDILDKYKKSIINTNSSIFKNVYNDIYKKYSNKLIEIKVKNDRVDFIKFERYRLENI